MAESTRRGRGLRILVTVLGSVVLLVLIGLARGLTLSSAEQTEPISYTGTAAEEVDAVRFTMDVGEVRFADALRTTGLRADDGQRYEANGVWLVVPVTLTATTEPLATVHTVRLESGGHAYGLAAEMQPSSPPRLDPGIPEQQTFYFEIPEEHLDDPTLRVIAGGFDARLSAEAVVDLQLDEQQLANRVAEAADEIEVEDTDTSPDGGVAEDQEVDAGA
ncbi:hypothetical protein RIF23_05105 [Lipingzhangella sp. LS1_29]|uniref:DUF4352 domain-containing protein n=1 Tax=Lipingzhangella rawalii TaxID=2055835 RepID=A0ABU2H2Y3_9ACTN|nr:hypothetical protein [Lipingzhangella rawalii]MDS1269667.1 hypothetical protein [Lipingzhangella rawalii]